MIEFASSNSGNISEDAFYDSDFSSITAGTFLIGSASHTGNIFIANDGGTLSFGSALSVQNSSSGIITIGDYTSSNDALTLTSAAGVKFLDLINGTSTVNLGSGALTISGAATLADNVNITATGGISFSSTIDADNAGSNDRTLTMTSGTGSTIACCRQHRCLTSTGWSWPLPKVMAPPSQAQLMLVIVIQAPLLLLILRMVQMLPLQVAVTTDTLDLGTNRL